MFVLRHSATAARSRVAVRWRRLNWTTCAASRTAQTLQSPAVHPSACGRAPPSARTAAFARMHKRARAQTRLVGWTTTHVLRSAWLQRADGPAVGREQHPVSEKRMSLAPKHVAAQHVVAHAAIRTNGTGARSDRPFFVDRRHSQMG
jgi:hypothetical protein